MSAGDQDRFWLDARIVACRGEKWYTASGCTTTSTTTRVRISTFHTAAVPGMEDAVADTKSEVRALLDSRSHAIRMKDIDRLMSLYSPDIVYFDLVPPLRYVGSAALRRRFSDWFDRWESAIGQDIGDVDISVSGDLAAAYMLIRASGLLKSGREVGYWVRVTNSFQRSNGRWLIAHEHVSLPVDLPSGSAAMDLVPDPTNEV
jgi:ketosteroid isomerase-like protein